MNNLDKLETMLIDLAEIQKRTAQKLEELITVVRDLGVIVASHERRLHELEG